MLETHFIPFTYISPGEFDAYIYMKSVQYRWFDYLTDSPPLHRQLMRKLYRAYSDKFRKCDLFV